ncbi:hypothetical protein B0H14DRAFT_2633012 [Mycena olivaceomarginata]|nr:hypothetical protein B0H14DRAFT_2633012 [Mycena olivaceomarginata]
MKGLQQFDEYYTANPADDEPAPSTSATADVESTALHHYGSSFLLDAVKSAQKSQQVATDPPDELLMSSKLRRTFCTGGETTSHTQHVPHGPRLSGHNSIAALMVENTFQSLPRAVYNLPLIRYICLG